VSNVVVMTIMFNSSSFNQDISNWNVNNVINCNSFSSGSDLEANNSPNFTNCTP
jgi:surface protein